MNVTLKPITEENFEDVCGLPLADEQYKFLSHNESSLLESHYYDYLKPSAIYLDDVPVGFLMWAEVSTVKVSVWRFMVTTEHQNKGVGRKALLLAIDKIKDDPGIEQIEICYSPDNIAAKTLYASIGFRETGMNEDGDEMLAVIKVDNPLQNPVDSNHDLEALSINEDSIVRSEEKLQGLYGAANPSSLKKESKSLTPVYQRWIEKAPFMAVASLGAGGLDCSPRGDAPGLLFSVLDRNTIAIPDRRGNNRLDTLRNIVSDPRVALLFMIPGIRECLRINGKAIVTTDKTLVHQFTVNGSSPVTVLIVTIDSVYFQCGRALLRSELWSERRIEDLHEVPTAGEMLKSMMADFDGDDYDKSLRERQQGTLY